VERWQGEVPVLRKGSYGKAAGGKSIADADGVQPDSASRPGPASPQGWDPFEVWLTRVKQPRDQGKRRQPRLVTVDSAATTDLSETARLRALAGARSR
jgi:hypothetical protein